MNAKWSTNDDQTMTNTETMTTRTMKRTDMDRYRRGRESGQEGAQMSAIPWGTVACSQPARRACVASQARPDQPSIHRCSVCAGRRAVRRSGWAMQK